MPSRFQGAGGIEEAMGGGPAEIADYTEFLTPPPVSFSQKASPRVPSRYRAFSIKIHGIIMRRSIVNTGTVNTLLLFGWLAIPETEALRKASAEWSTSAESDFDIRNSIAARSCHVNAPLLPSSRRFLAEGDGFPVSKRDHREKISFGEGKEEEGRGENATTI